MSYDSVVQDMPGNLRTGRISSDIQCIGPPSLPDSCICGCPKNTLQVKGKATCKSHTFLSISSTKVLFH